MKYVDRVGKYCGLSRCSTARGSGTCFFLVDTAKVKAHKSFRSTEVSLEVEINKQLITNLLQGP